MIRSGYVASNQMFYPMIRLATETDATFAPYTNVCPISGHTEASVQRDGVNLIENNTFSGVGTFIQSTVFPVTGAYIHRNATFSGSGAFTFKLFGIKNGIETVIDEAGYGVSFNDIRNNVSQYDHIRVSGYSNDATNSLTNIMVAFSDTDTPLPYEPYQGKTYTIALGDTIYGGTMDFDSGVMTVDRKYIEFDGGETETWTKRSGANSYQHTEDLGIIDASSAVTAISNLGRQNFNGAYYGTEFAFGYAESNHVLYVGAPNIENAEDFKTYLSNNHLQIVGTLVTPLTVQLTPQQIQLLKGQNTLTASTGQISVTVNGVNGAIGSLTSDKQDKTDYALETTEKTVVGGINELKDRVKVIEVTTSDTVDQGTTVKVPTGYDAARAVIVGYTAQRTNNLWYNSDDHVDVGMYSEYLYVVPKNADVLERTVKVVLIKFSA